MENMVVPSRRGSWIVAAVFVAVVCVGAWVGIRAGDLAHRAPRGSGTRIAVLGPLSASGTELDLATLVQDAIVRDLSSLPTVTVIPPLELRSKRLQMLRGGVDDASDADAAKVLDADVVLLVRMDPRTGAAELVKDGAVLAHIDAARIHDAAIDGANVDGANANGANTNGANAYGANANGANANGANMNGANMNGANVNRANANGANASGANASTANVNAANADGANLNSADVNAANTNGANVNAANLNGANANSANMNSANMNSANVNSASANSASANSANVNGANVNGANANSANVNGANVNGANVNAANVNGANVSGANTNGANVNGANVNGANANGANTNGANVNGANVNGANVNGANANGANAYGANAYGANANANAANVNGANVDGANVNGANANGANANGANANGANTNGANVNAANLNGANANSANMNSANMNSANVNSASANSANVNGANVNGANANSANVNGANASGANASGADVNGANVNGANAYGADANGALADTAHFGGTLTQLPALLATARAVVPGAGPPGAPATMSAVAYAHFLAGEKLAQGSGLLRDAAPHFERAIAADGAFADAWAALAWCSFLTDDRSPQQTTRTKEAVASARRHRARLGTQASLVVDALAGWLEHDDAPPSLQPALREPAIAGARALTVRLPEERNGHLLLGRAYRELFHGASEGLRHLEAGRRLTPDYFPITQQIVIAWLDLSDRNHAEQALRGFLTTSLGHVEATRLLAGLTRTPSAAR